MTHKLAAHDDCDQPFHHATRLGIWSRGLSKHRVWRGKCGSTFTMKRVRQVAASQLSGRKFRNLRSSLDTHAPKITLFIITTKSP